MPRDGGGLVDSVMNMADQLDVLLEPMKCGVSAFSALPTLFYLSGTVMLLHQIVTTSGRTLFWRRTHRDLILQEILLVWLIGQSLRLWWTIVKFISIFAAWLWKEMVMMYPPTSYYELLNGYKPVPSLPVPILFVLEPGTLKNIILMVLSILPLVFIQNIQSRGNLSHFMFWIGANRRTRSEIGTAGYYLERPIPITVNISDESPGTSFRNSDPSFFSEEFAWMNKSKQRSKSI
nr:PREDICTED: uncharacterized protein LOC109037521 [Bemisia tabaci]